MLEKQTGAQMKAERERLLDNPIWSALTTVHAPLAEGGLLARRYPAAIGPLSGLAEQSDEAYEELRALAGPGGIVGLFLNEAPRARAGWKLIRGGTLCQMVADGEARESAAEPDRGEVRVLGAEDVPAMVALAKLTEPGPFRERTHELGRFFGVVEDGRLLAMAGKRMHVPGFIEVSAVCTHPDARGRGYARLLMRRVMDEIVGAGSTPFLHSFANNYGAIRVYESLGFRVRRTAELAILENQA
jgi:ribosomal protein S18 acetylase RimI-like enzyme